MIDFTTHPGRHVADIEIFALSYCPYCKETKAYLNDHDIEYKFVDVDTAPDAVEIDKVVQKYNPQDTYPTVVVDGGKEVIVGFQQEALDKLIAA